MYFCYYYDDLTIFLNRGNLHFFDTPSNGINQSQLDDYDTSNIIMLKGLFS